MLDNSVLKDVLYGEFARIGKSLSSPKRLEILDLLSQSPKSVETLANDTEMTVANVSKHLQTLYHAKLVTFKKKGNYVIYELADEAVVDFMNCLRSLSEKQLVKVQQIKEEFLNHQDGIEGISLAELNKRMEIGEILLIDVRPKEEYEVAHIPGAISIPLQELEENLSAFPSHYDVVAYCRGPYCVMSVKAVELLTAKGFNAFRLENSVHDWQKFRQES
ncbi:ArsR family transcriptional regulator [Bacillus sp. Bva_UNVM-123]|uniref:ArsR/SmtB family transcription factor n=1 Tax=Bacillus sp. Bva_UNVM-123 TaxID=2829798 RepID=UPI00391F0186